MFLGKLFIVCSTCHDSLNSNCLKPLEIQGLSVISFYTFWLSTKIGPRLVIGTPDFWTRFAQLSLMSSRDQKVFTFTWIFVDGDVRQTQNNKSDDSDKDYKLTSVKKRAIFFWWIFPLTVVTVWKKFIKKPAKIFKGKGEISLITPFRVNGCAQLLLSFLHWRIATKN